MLTQQRLIELFDYNKETGDFTRKVSVGINGNHKKGKIVGCPDKNNCGYVRIGVDGKIYLAHRLAWLYVYGTWPINLIDHIDHNTGNNAINNLRDVSRNGNAQNLLKATKRNKSSGYLGVYYIKDVKKYMALLVVDGNRINLGYFLNAEDAHNEYLKAKRKFHETCVI